MNNKGDEEYIKNFKILENMTKEYLKLKYFLLDQLFHVFNLKNCFNKMPNTFIIISGTIRKIVDISTYVKAIMKINSMFDLGLMKDVNKMIIFNIP